MKNFEKGANLLSPNKAIKDFFIKNPNGGLSVFTYRGYIVRIAHSKNEYLRLSCSNEDMLVQLIPIGNEVMNSKMIASYLMDSDDFAEMMSTVEWNTTNPVQRQAELSENDRNKLGFKCINLCLNNENQVQEKGATKKKSLF